MNTYMHKGSSIALLVSSVILGGCGTMQGGSTAAVDPAQQAMLEKKDQEIATLKSSLDQAGRDLQMARTAQASSAASKPDMNALASNQLLPPGAKPGQCYARAFVPPTYKTETLTVLKSEASEDLEIVPATYQWVEERVLVKEASERIEVVPATYGWSEERVMVKPASTRMEAVPPVYKTVTEKVLDKPAHTIWKKGTGPITKVDEATGEIMCLVEVPATYKTISKRMLVTPATTRSVEIPAEYKNVRKQVMKTPPSTRTVSIPAEYKTVKVRKQVSETGVKHIPVPARYDTVTKRTMVTEGHVEWKPVLCRTNMSPAVIMDIQRALDKAGYNPGYIDGILGKQTMTAVKSYQQAKKLPQGGLTMETLSSLGLRL